MDEEILLSDLEGEEGTTTNANEEDDKVQAQPLTKDTIKEGLSFLCRTGDRLGHAFIKLNLQHKKLNDIATISGYIHIRLLDLSNNYLNDLSPLASLKHLLWLKVDKNDVVSFQGQPFAELIYLQRLSMAANQLNDVNGLVGPALESLNLKGNNIQQLHSFQTGCFGSLLSLELRGNRLETTDGLNLPNLQRLYLAENMIKHLEGLDKLESLTILHLRDNKLETLDGLSSNMKCLRYLNVRGNLITEGKALQSIGLVAKSLQALVLSENPLVATSDYRFSVLTLLPHLKRLDKEPVSPEERSENQMRIRELEEEEAPEP
ncbi:leucine-rich repeat-containing protein 23 isoform X1 [Oryzias melastigma]|uniref:Leucine-rich repeat-containing protein 23 n=1 Tax=Oryzias melastigma TaxID=30732 RepID=A0A3B3C6B8_ORYME|nr:leucine-rich repeat-containing protein 23 isoform X1 [Oryzias melastigma]